MGILDSISGFLQFGGRETAGSQWPEAGEIACFLVYTLPVRPSIIQSLDISIVLVPQETEDLKT